MIGLILPFLLRAGALFKAIPMWVFVLAGVVAFAWIQTARLYHARDALRLERDNHEVTRGSVWTLKQSIADQNKAVDAIKIEAGARVKTGISAVAARREHRGAEDKRIARIMLPAPLSGRCVTPASVLESGL